MSQDFPTPLEIKALAEGEFALQWADEIMQTVCTYFYPAHLIVSDMSLKSPQI